MKDLYLTIEKTTEGLYKETGSKFLAMAFPVSTREEISERLAELRKKYHDARHHCYAWRLGADMEEYRVNDDGEPSGSAGLPIFGQIQSRDLSNVLVVVVRYFGGTLLGVGGLIRAYRAAASGALAPDGEAGGEGQPLYLFVKEDDIQAYILPVHSRGLWGKIDGYLALEKDGVTIAGFTVPQMPAEVPKT